MPETPAVTVVICTRRRPELLPQSVAAVLAQELDVPYEVVVVNDDDEPLRCRLPDDDRLRVVSGQQRGIAAAHNIGIRAAQAPIIAFTDDDTVAPTDWLANVRAVFAAHPEALGVEGPVVYGREVDALYEHVPYTELPGGYCGCNVAYRREALFAAGLFDERFVVPGGEDIDVGLRVAQVGPVVVAPDMTMVHPPRPISVRERVLRGRAVKSDWLLHTKHPQLSGRPRPTRWGPIGWRTRSELRLLRNRELIAGSPKRAARATAIAVGTIVVTAASVCTGRMPTADGS